MVVATSQIASVPGGQAINPIAVAKGEEVKALNVTAVMTPKVEPPP